MPTLLLGANQAMIVYDPWIFRSLVEALLLRMFATLKASRETVATVLM